MQDTSINRTDNEDTDGEEDDTDNKFTHVSCHDEFGFWFYASSIPAMIEWTQFTQYSWQGCF